MVHSKQTAIDFHIDAKRLENTIRFLDNEIEEWRNKDASVVARLLMTFYEGVDYSEVPTTIEGNSGSGT